MTTSAIALSTPSKKSNQIKLFALGALASVTLVMDSEALKPQKTDAAPFAQNTIALAKGAFAGNTSLVQGISAMEWVVYMIPVIAIVGGFVAMGVARDAQNGETFKTILGIVIGVWSLIGLLWIYDTNFVPKTITGQLPHFVVSAIAKGI